MSLECFLYIPSPTMVLSLLLYLQAAAGGYPADSQRILPCHYPLPSGKVLKWLCPGLGSALEPQWE